MDGGRNQTGVQRERILREDVRCRAIVGYQPNGLGVGLVSEQSTGAKSSDLTRVARDTVEEFLGFELGNE